MSGGHFYSSPYQLVMLAEELDDFIKSQTSEKNSTESYNFNAETLSKIQETIDALNKTYNMVKKVDYLLCGDDSEATFLNNW